MGWVLLSPLAQLAPLLSTSFPVSHVTFLLMLLSLGIATAITTIFLSCLSTTTISGWLAPTILFVCFWKSHRIVAYSFSTIFGNAAPFDPGTSKPFSMRIFIYTMPTTWLWHSKFAIPAFILQPAVMCWIVSGASFYSLQLGTCLVL